MGAGGEDRDMDRATGYWLLATLTVLTVVSGVVDAVTYLGLGRVFTANMTGNAVVLGFAATGTVGFSVAATLTSIGGFLVGAALAGRIERRIPSRRRLLVAAMVSEGVLTLVAAVVALAAATFASGWARFTIIAALAVGMGIRNATVQRLAVPAVTTTVLTGTLTSLAADSSLAGGSNPQAGRKIAAVAAMLLGAAGGAWFYRHHAAGPPLLTVALVVLGAAALYAAEPSLRRLAG
jgi:uncharacterized membrane protein YoaK (UPF0700 family)